MRATAFSIMSRTRPYPREMRFSARTYLTEVRRFRAILQRSVQQREEMSALARELEPLLQDHRFISKLTSQGFTTIPMALAEALKRQPDPAAAELQSRPRISPRAMALLKDRELLTGVYGVLEKMPPPRQIEAVRRMIASNWFTPSYALHLLARSQEVPLSAEGRPKKITVFTPELRKIMITEAEVLGERLRVVATEYAERLIELMAAKGYVRAVLENTVTRAYLTRRHASSVRKLGAAVARH